MAIILSAANAFAIIIRIDALTQMEILITSLNIELAICYSHSFVLIASSLALILWIYQHTETCYHLNDDSVCVRYGCDLFIMFLYDVCNCCASYIENRSFQERLIGTETEMELKQQTTRQNKLTITAGFSKPQTITKFSPNSP